MNGSGEPARGLWTVKSGPEAAVAETPARGPAHHKPEVSLGSDLGSSFGTGAPSRAPSSL